MLSGVHVPTIVVRRLPFVRHLRCIIRRRCMLHSTAILLWRSTCRCGGAEPAAYVSLDPAAATVARLLGCPVVLDMPVAGASHSRVTAVSTVTMAIMPLVPVVVPLAVIAAIAVIAAVLSPVAARISRPHSAVSRIITVRIIIGCTAVMVAVVAGVIRIQPTPLYS